MANNGWFLVHRRLFDHEIGQNPLIVALWVKLIALASYEDKEVWFDGSVIEIKRGQLVTSLKKLGQWLGVSRSNTKRYLNGLQKIHQIAIRTTNKYSVITIQNYNRYQVDGTQEEHRRNTNGTQMDTTNKNNKYKKNKEGDISLLELTQKQKEKLKKEYPNINFDIMYLKFRAYQKANSKTYPNPLEAFRMWLIEDNSKKKKGILHV